ncbi:hypothetical protein E4P39_07020 [Blastococcus sp. CT_GayMR19]|nr:hypothetical protein E4P39_07020 [Blastococcus sp. CT_GayMR19]
MSSRGLLVATSTAQLGAQLAGLAVAVGRKRYFDVGFMRGSPEHIGRDAVWNGTAYSAPVTMLITQLWAVRRLAAGPDDLARRVLGLLGTVNVPGYLSERFFRQHLRPGGWDPVETPVLAASIALAAGMAVLGHRAQAGR